MPHMNREKLNSIVYPTPNLQCPPHGYRTHVLSASPLVLYLEDFLSPTEVHELVQLSNPSYQPSTLFTSSRESHDPTIRLSEKSLLPRSNTVRCIEARALALQGWPQDTFIERLWTQRYNVSGHYKLHYDWGAASPKARRASSFMVYLSGGRDEGEAGEEKLEGEEASQERREWCDFISCPASSSSSSSSASASDSNDGVTFLPMAGNAVFWQNFDAAGRGHKETLHAGLPVTKGQKIGLNIWSWYQAGHRAPEEGPTTSLALEQAVPTTETEVP
ncbi:uncharacterized protein K489DRAFT_386127 [Dissoconium aciculare CBS 342.82]|uniref:Prolyl 4-hydroxylase alpha subunit domain-containing protein n=1 Tax=Dissoconium aciculare CBS 342.82 TaxID=1314786 RepID=A0A6J3MIQ9_9PEZI|nr:uncharacterized protein K489DRAFT_386127 [Dissoconium aciculare CBS 342.82]KAF1827589.1 hypothetical protein K489DRAFT_386127 [Dissoconium aciculare CBS 342.82]